MRFLFGPVWMTAMAITSVQEGSGEDGSDAISWDLEEDLWYGLRMQNTSAGVLRCTTERSGRLVRTRDDMTVKINRGEDSVTLWFLTEMIEDAETGRVLRSGYTQQMAEDRIVMDYAFNESAVAVTSVQAGRTHTSSLPAISENHLARHAVRLYIREQLKVGATTINYLTIKPEMGAKLHNCSMEFQRQEDTMVREEKIAATVWDTTIEGMPIKVTEWMNDRGDVVRMFIDSGAGVIEAVLSTKSSAQDAAAAETEAPELVDSTHVVLSRPAPELHAWSGASSAVFTVWSKNGQTLELPTAGYIDVPLTHVAHHRCHLIHDGQRRYQEVIVSDKDAKKYTVTINLQNPLPATTDELVDTNYINPSAMIDTTDAAVRAIASAALGELFTFPRGPRSDTDVYSRARRLRDAVKAHITTFNLKTGYASASETARRGEGDCSEHAVLLAALLRVDEIPSRVCSGIVYTERAAHSYLNSGDAVNGGRDRAVVGSFAWHAWTQALIGGKWMDLDATLHSSAYSVGHVLMGTSGMDDGAGHSDEMIMVSMIGNLEMEVDSVK